MQCTSPHGRMGERELLRPRQITTGVMFGYKIVWLHDDCFFFSKSGGNMCRRLDHILGEILSGFKYPRVFVLAWWHT